MVALVTVCSGPAWLGEMLPAQGVHGHSEVSTAFRTKSHGAFVSPVISVLTGKAI